MQIGSMKDVERIDVFNRLEHKEKKKVALTFDDGPHPIYTAQLLDLLKEKQVKATFFLIGENAKADPELVKREVIEGHMIGNHTFHHVNLKKRSKEEGLQEILSTTALLEKLTKKEIEYMRPPYGEWEKEMEEEYGLMPVLWQLDTKDWMAKSSDEIRNKVVTEVKENDIILLHDCCALTVDAVGKIIEALEAEYEFVTIDELLLD